MARSRKMETVYVETTVIGHVAGRLHPDPLIAPRQQFARRWWPELLSKYRVVISQLVIDECRAGDADTARERLELVENMELLYGVEYLVSWNFRHIVNAAMRARIEKVCRDAGFEPTIICSPEELAAEEDNEISDG